MKLERCFEGTPDISPNLIERDVDIESASDHIEKAEGNLHAAKLMEENKIFDWQIVCSYYAMYHLLIRPPKSKSFEKWKFFKSCNNGITSIGRARSKIA